MQRLILPINNCKINAGYKLDVYHKKFGFIHYGVDLGSTDGSTQVYACGDGEVIAAGMDGKHDKDRLGNCIVIVYRDVRLPDGRQLDLACRMFHFAKIYCKAGDIVTKDTVIGLFGSTGAKSTGAHLHIEFDTDVQYPCHAYGIASSGNVIKKGVIDSTVHPSLVWYRDHNQRMIATQETIKGGWCSKVDIEIPALSTEDGSDQPIVLKQGIDVAAHQGVVGWQKVKAAGKEYAFIRLGWCGYDGCIVANGGLDKQFHRNMKAAIGAGLKVGVYVYSYAKTAEAAHVAALETLGLIQPYTIEYPIAFDIEDPMYTHMDKDLNTQIADAFLSCIAQSNYYAMLYTYKYFADGNLDMTRLGAYDVWIAQYAAQCTYAGKYGIWQYAGDKGTCSGVSGACDLDVAYKDYAAIIKAAGLNRLSGTPIQPANPAPDTPDRVSVLEEVLETIQPLLDKISDMINLVK